MKTNEIADRIDMMIENIRVEIKCVNEDINNLLGKEEIYKKEIKDLEDLKNFIEKE
jgi:uncharacterized protein YfkK (UPF0435 family)